MEYKYSKNIFSALLIALFVVSVLYLPAKALGDIPTSPIITTPSQTTNNNTPAIYGTAVPDSSIQLYDGSSPIGSPVVATTGFWSITTPILSDGTHSITVTATNSGGTSPSSLAITVTIDSTSPLVVLITNSSFTTNNPTPKIIGTAETGSLVKLYDGATQIGFKTSIEDKWSITASALSDGVHILKATATSKTCTVSPNSNSITVTINTTPPPSAPVITTPSQTINNNTLSVSGTAVTGSSVQIYEGVLPIGSPGIATTGSWSITTPPLSDGIHALTATSTNVGGTSPNSNQVIITVSTPPTVITQMNDSTASYGLNVYSIVPIQAEYVSNSSSLVGKSIDNIVVSMKRVGSPPGIIQVGVFNNDQSVKQIFGTINASSVTTAYKLYSISLSSPQSYQIQSGDRIGVKFTGGSTGNTIGIMTDQVNTFDGTNSYLTSYDTMWRSYTGKDMYMALKLHVYNIGPTVSASPPAGTYTGSQSVTLTSSVPGTIYYTTDGSTPTISSINGLSPISGITVSTNSTLKFFAKDVSNNAGPTSSASYTILPIPTVSASPPAGTYTGSQSVTLTSSVPGTIYYTTDGSTPTISSTNGPSPVLLNISTNSTLKFFAKNLSNNSGPIGTAQYIILLPVTIQMNDSTASYGLNVYSIVPIQAEYVSNSSSLVGKSIDNIVVSMKRVGSPPGIIQVGVFNNDQSVKQIFGTINASSVTTAYKLYSISLSSPQSYQIQSGDRIGVKFTGGSNSTNTIGIMTDQVNTFDGTNSYLTSYDTMWRSYTGKDMYMALKLHTH